MIHYLPQSEQVLTVPHVSRDSSTAFVILLPGPHLVLVLVHIAATALVRTSSRAMDNLFLGQEYQRLLS